MTFCARRYRLRRYTSHFALLSASPIRGAFFYVVRASSAGALVYMFES